MAEKKEKLDGKAFPILTFGLALGVFFNFTNRIHCNELGNL